MTILLILIIILIYLAIIIYGSVIFVLGMAYGYWGLSMGMAPVLWLLMFIGGIVGFLCAAKNAFKAARAIKAEKRE